jgi:hypothetical protein
VKQKLVTVEDALSKAHHADVLKRNLAERATVGSAA